MSQLYAREMLPALCALFLLTANFALSRRKSPLPEVRIARWLYSPLRYNFITFVCIVILSFLATNLIVPKRVLSVLAKVQKKQKVLEKAPTPRNQPVIIFEAKHSGKPINFAEGFDGDDDWLKNTGFRVKNVSVREIVYLQLDLNFPPTQALEREMSFPLTFGRHPNLDNSSKPPFSLPPGGEMDIALDEETYQKLARFVAHRRSISSINKSVVWLGFVVFADGLGYSGSYYVRRDPLDQQRWVPIADAQGNPITP